jgi:hypothetical protein
MQQQQQEHVQIQQQAGPQLGPSSAAAAANAVLVSSVASAASSRPDWLRELDNSAVPDVDFHDLPKPVAQAVQNETSWGAKGPRAALAAAIRRAELTMQQGGAAVRQAPTPPPPGGPYDDDDDRLDGGGGGELELGGVRASSINLARSLASESKFIFPVHAEKEWGTLKSPGVGLNANPAAQSSSAARGPASGRRGPSAMPRTIDESDRRGGDATAAAAVEESRLVYPNSEVGGEWNSFGELDSAASAAVPAMGGGGGGGGDAGGLQPVLVSPSGDGGGVGGGSLGEDSVDLLLARNEERLRRLETIAT